MSSYHCYAASIIAALFAISCGSDPNSDSNSDDKTPGDRSSDSPNLDLDDNNGNGNGDDKDITVDDLRSSSCADWSATPEALPVTLELVIDVSGSMDSRPPNATNRSTKWDLTRDALLAALDVLPPETGVGCVFYPAQQTSEWHRPQPASMCINFDAIIDINPLGPADSSHRETLRSVMVDDIEPDGGTPTHDALIVARNQLVNADSDGKRFLLLITDGQPTYDKDCIGTGNYSFTPDTDAIIDSVREFAAEGIDTFVIGSPGSEQGSGGQDMRPWLSQAAEAGNTATSGCKHTAGSYCHFDMVEEPDFGAALEKALEKIAGTITACDYAIPEPPAGKTIDLDTANVVLTPPDKGESKILEFQAEQDCTAGWHYSSDKKRVQLCSATCKYVQENQGSKIELFFGCDTHVAPIR